MNADFVLIFFKWKLKVVLYILVTIAIIEYPYTYSFYDRKLTQYHNSWTADVVVTVTTVIISYCSINLVSQSLTTENLYFRLISTISTFIRVGYLHSHAAQRSAALWRASALDLKRRSWSWPLQLLYDHVLCVGVSMCTQSEVNITWLSRSSSAAQLTD